MNKLKIEDYSIKKSSFAEIRTNHIFGEKSLHSTKSFEPKDLIARFIINETLIQPNYLSIQASEYKHCMVDPEYLHYINHSCDPNCFFDMDEMILLCIKSIKIGDEFRFFYPSTDWNMIQPFNCICQAKGCLGSIQGSMFLESSILKKYKLSRYVNEMVNQKISISR
ncbi:MAG: SET domain-containing protein-lysine N-methyltransferase [Thermosynechococcaceae cyanobacterium]